MALTITNANALNTVGECFKVVVNASNPPANTIRKIRYTLLAQDNTEILPPQSIPLTGQDVALDFAPHLQGQIHTSVPLLNTKFRAIDPNFSASFKVFVEQVDFDTNSCAAPTVSESLTTLERKIFNVAPQYWQNGLMTTTSPVFFTYKPSQFYLTRNQNDWLWFYTGSGATFSMVVTTYNQAGVGVGQLNESLMQDAVYYMGVGAANISGFTVPSDTARMQIDFRRDGSTIQTYNIVFIDDCEEESWREIYFQEPLGGISSLLMDTFEFTPNRSVSSIELEQECNLALGLNATKTGGLSGTNSQSFRTIRWTKEIDNSTDFADFLDGLAASHHFWVRQKIGKVLDLMTKITINPGSIQTRNIEGNAVVSITGRIFKNINTVSNRL